MSVPAPSVAQSRARSAVKASRIHEYPGGVKQCTKCDQTKPVDSFYWLISKNTEDGGSIAFRRGTCIECYRGINRARVSRARKERVARISARAPWSKGGPRPYQARHPEFVANTTAVKSVVRCVCGARKVSHVGGKGRCYGTGCSEFMERGL